LGADALLAWLSNPTPPVPQPDEGATYASKVTKAEARIDWSRPASEIERQVRAFAPAPGAWFEANGERIKLLETSIESSSGQPGQVVDDLMSIACGQGSIRPLLVQRAGRGLMPPRELLRGFPIPKGTILA
jgi:methionyl-tRNA formyltransferase